MLNSYPTLWLIKILKRMRLTFDNIIIKILKINYQVTCCPN